MKPKILILQYPQEQSKNLATAPIVSELLENARVRSGMSWANLSRAWGENVQSEQREWGVLFLGTGIKWKGLPQDTLYSIKKDKSVEPFKGQLKGIIVLDGNWSQAKTLWWRNSWLLRLRRLAYLPSKRSLYGKLRREPRRECLSTLESIAWTLGSLGHDDDRNQLLQGFKKKLGEFKDLESAHPKKLSYSTSTSSEQSSSLA